MDGLGCTGFLNNGSVIENEADENDNTQYKKPNYQNLKTQCYFFLADMIKQSKIGIIIPESIGELYQSDLEEMIQDELGAIKEENIDKDGKRCITTKKDIKESIGRSPDRADNLMMRMYPLLKKELDLSWALSKDQNEERRDYDDEDDD